MTDLVQSYHIQGSTAGEIAGSVESAVRAGGLQAGERMPTVRGLAIRLGVSPVTVAAAYRRLSERGVLSAAGRRGTFVCPGAALPSRYDVPLLPSGVRDLASGNPDPALLPDLGAALRHLDLPRQLYGGDATRADLLELAAEDLHADGIVTDALAVVGGAMDGIERTLQAHLRAGDRVAVEDPIYPAVRDLVGALGLATEPVAVDDSGPLPGELERALSRGVAALLVTPRAQNPTGAALDEARAAALRAVLAGHPGVLLIEDDHAAQIAGAPSRSLSPGHDGPWAVLRSVAKKLGPDLRLAVMAGDPGTVARVSGRQRLGTGWVSHILQETVVTLWRDPATAALVERATAAYSERRAAIIDALAANGLRAHGRSGLNVWVPVPEEGAMVQFLLGRGWGVRGGERFRFRTGPAIRVTASVLRPGEAERLAADIAEMVGGSRRTGVA
ncbi:MAG TPA: aminotransferase class I/II-fold pyridoxal phosphate-dependent enzyme [Candidatus Dormibacteraeota bacterium]|jgi:DNA-binding transcriptional MocR family regulator|nr:aminotransferase class I/II-fold pyridoxal phosphate-dependent enzyme [Candidatus Dormibacteraeota bacterium]